MNWKVSRKANAPKQNPPGDMSASGYKQTLWSCAWNVRFTPESGRKWVTEFMSAYDPKRTLRHFPIFDQLTSHPLD
jgi:hypothetical protein